MASISLIDLLIFLIVMADVQCNKICEIGNGETVKNCSYMNYKSITAFAELNELHFNDNKLSDVTIFNNSSIMYLFIGNNLLETIDGLNVKNLHTLMVDNNLLKSIETNLFLNMRVFSANRNEIRTIKEGVFKNSTLKILHLSQNKLENVRFLKELTQVSNVDLSCNNILRIISLPDYHSKSIITLDFSCNRIEDLTKFFPMKSNSDSGHCSTVEIAVQQHIKLKLLNNISCCSCDEYPKYFVHKRLNYDSSQMRSEGDDVDDNNPSILYMAQIISICLFVIIILALIFIRMYLKSRQRSREDSSIHDESAYVMVVRELPDLPGHVYEEIR